MEPQFPSQSSRQPQIIPFLTLLLCFPKIHFCIIAPSTLRSSEWSLSLHIRNKSVHALLCIAMHTKQLTRLSMLDLIIVRILDEVKIRNLLYKRHYVSSCLFSLLLFYLLLFSLLLFSLLLFSQRSPQQPNLQTHHRQNNFFIHRVKVNLQAPCT